MNKVAFGLVLAFVSICMAGEKGGKERGGADVAIFKDSSGKVVGAEIFDFVEGSDVYGYKIVKQDHLPIKSQLENAITKISPHFSKNDMGKIAKYIWDVYNRLELVDKVPSIEDTYPNHQINVLELGEMFRLNSETLSFGDPIKFSQLALYEQSNVRVSREIYQHHLKNTSRSGLIFHEGFYKFMREIFKAKDSTLTRRWNAYAFSEN